MLLMYSFVILHFTLLFVRIQVVKSQISKTFKKFLRIILRFNHSTCTKILVYTFFVFMVLPPSLKLVSMETLNVFQIDQYYTIFLSFFRLHWNIFFLHCKDLIWQPLCLFLPRSKQKLTAEEWQNISPKKYIHWIFACWPSKSLNKKLLWVDFSYVLPP